MPAARTRPVSVRRGGGGGRGDLALCVIAGRLLSRGREEGAGGVSGQSPPPGESERERGTKGRKKKKRKRGVSRRPATEKPPACVRRLARTQPHTARGEKYRQRLHDRPGNTHAAWARAASPPSMVPLAKARQSAPGGSCAAACPRGEEEEKEKKRNTLPVAAVRDAREGRAMIEPPPGTAILLAWRLDFTDVYKQSSGLCAFSPDGRHIATAVLYRLVVRDAETLQIVHLFTCTDLVQAVDWSADSRLVLCASFKLGAVNVWSLEDASWSAKIDEGAAGLTSVRFAPDGRHVLCFSDFQVRPDAPVLIGHLPRNPLSFLGGVIFFSSIFKHLLVAQLRVTIWSLLTRDAVYIRYPKNNDKGSIRFWWGSEHSAL
ncbi:MAG: hypothetical protein BJ554DRAFT_5286 [Olpidium bornovanus]|uniref:WD repeat-containing protein WRAP73 n=1 Tax=Olpidium bornovanus TaxID=278681 RepID=A0A8H8DL73_9FUNG|nr:MAG: hypothetical protein BJ554DRAFT_5286 [Olpidium bornovanus]